MPNRPVAEREPRAGEATGAPTTLVRAYAEITAILARLRESRSVLEQSAIERLASMHAKLREVSSATEIAATDILNGLDRALAMMDELDTLALRPDTAAQAAAVRGRMRDELFGLMVPLQFQDITTQQLAFASSVIADTEQRLALMVSLFEPHHLDGASAVALAAARDVQFDPGATVANASDRQALADEIFTAR